MRRKQVAPYRLCIHTSDYTGNFERELIGYCLGVLDGRTEENLWEYDPDDYCKHWFYQDVMARKERGYRGYYDALTEKFREVTGYEDELGYCDHPLLQEYLFETFQDVDDWQQDTFYYIDKYFKDKEYDCNSLYIQLDKPLNEVWEEIVINRIFMFFKDERIRKEEYGTLQFADWDKRKLISIELINDKDEVVKSYPPECKQNIGFMPVKDYFTMTLPNWNEEQE